MQKVADIFAFWPSDADLGRDIDVPYPTVAAWKQRDSIPTSYWRAIIRAARKRGYPDVTADLLLAVHAHASSSSATGFKEDEGAPFVSSESGPARNQDDRESGHFSRHKSVRRNHFKTAEEIEEHIRALREEWSHR